MKETLKDCKTFGEIIEFFMVKNDLKDWKPGIVTRGFIIAKINDMITLLSHMKNNKNNGI